MVPEPACPICGMALDRALGHTPLAWVERALATAVVLLGGRPFFERPIRSIASAPVDA